MGADRNSLFVAKLNKEALSAILSRRLTHFKARHSNNVTVPHESMFKERARKESLEHKHDRDFFSLHITINTIQRLS